MVQFSLPNPFAFIPRLIVHKDEIERIYHPSVKQYLAPRYRRRRRSQSLPPPSSSSSSSVTTTAAAAATTTTTTTVPVVQRTSSDLVRDVVVRRVPEKLHRIASVMVQDIVRGPQLVMHRWRELVLLLFLQTFFPLFLIFPIYFVPLANITDGTGPNRSFTNGYLFYYSFLASIPFINTCNFAMPEAGFPVKDRFCTLLFALVLQQLFFCLVTEVMHVFPIPFGLQQASFIAYLSTVPSLWLISKQRTSKRNFILLFKLLSVYMASLAVVGLWAVCIRRLEGLVLWQSLLGASYGLLRFICKILLAAPLTTRINPRRWIILNLVIDLLFTRVQISTFPFIDGFFTLFLLMSTEVGTFLWRYYNGVDRLALWFGATFGGAAASTTTTDEEGEEKHAVHRAFGCSWKSVTIGCFSAPISQIACIQLQLRQCQKHAAAQENCSVEFESEVSTPNEKPRRYTDPFVSTVAIVPPNPADNIGILKSEPPHLMVKSSSIPNQIDSGSKVEPPSVAEGLSVVQVEDVSKSGPVTNLRQRPADSLDEEIWEQRPLYHIIDSIGSILISIMARIDQQVSISLARGLPIARRLNEAFVTDDKHWHRAQFYGWLYIFAMTSLLGFLGWIFFSRLERSNPARRKLTLSRVVSYLVRDHFWFFTLWLTGTGSHVVSTMVQHFGADFTLDFEWVGCPSHQIVWPHCSNITITGASV